MHTSTSRAHYPMALTLDDEEEEEEVAAAPGKKSGGGGEKGKGGGPSHPASSSSSSSSSDEVYPSFALRCSSAKGLFSAASALWNTKKEQNVTMAVNAKGLRLIVENTSKSLYATANLPANQFQEFSLPLVRGEHTEVAFRLPMWALIDCLVIYGTAALATVQLTMAYNSGGPGELSLVLFEDGGVLTEAFIKTMDLTTVLPEGGGGGGGAESSSLETAFQNVPRPIRIVLKSDTLHDIIKDVCTAPGATSVAVNVDPPSEEGGSGGVMRLHTVAPGGTLTLEIPSTSPSVVSMAVKEGVAFSYHTKLLEASLKALSGSSQTLIRINAAGVLSVTHRLEMDKDGVGGGGGSTGGAAGSIGVWVTTLILPEEEAGEEGEGDYVKTEEKSGRARTEWVAEEEEEGGGGGGGGGNWEREEEGMKGKGGAGKGKGGGGGGGGAGARKKARGGGIAIDEDGEEEEGE